jgi:GDP-L-fucose synthase
MWLNQVDKDSKIYIAGHTGLVGSALVRQLYKKGYKKLVYRTHKELDLIDKTATADFFSSEKPEYVFLAAARVGGIRANKAYPAEFIYENLQIQTNIIHQAYKYKVQKLLFLGSSCMFPRLCEQPMNVQSILTSPLEPTNKPYAIAKLAGLEMCQSYRLQYSCDFITVIPANLYGMNDNFNPEDGHVIPALIRRFHEARNSNSASVTLWGTGTAKREFLYVDDMVEAVLLLIEKYSNIQPINIGSNSIVTIRELATIISKMVGFNGGLEFDTSKPDGMPSKQLDNFELTKFGWQKKQFLEEGLQKTYD